MSGEFDMFMNKLTELEKSRNPYEAEDKELTDALENIWEIAHQFKLDPFPTNFEVVPPDIMSELGSYGIPNRFSHWTHGRAYRQQKTMYDHGMSKIYELVINSNPSQAFLLENNPPIENKFVMAHVLGHTDFFKNNFRFEPTQRDMPDVAGHHAARLERYEAQNGRLAVEGLLDAVLAIEEHVDPHESQRPWRDDELRLWREMAARAINPKPTQPGEFDDLFDTPAMPTANENHALGKLHVPPSPDRDILGFIRNHAPYMEDWERDAVDIVRSESIYFYPQRRTKIMNEGWAAYWHKRIMREMGDRDLITDKENEAWWVVHSSVVAPGRQSLNPYYLGMKMYEYLEDYYNGNLSEREQAWLEKEGKPIYPKFEGKLEDSPASEKLREVMMHNDDQSFIRNYFDKNVADRMNMYIYEEWPSRGGGTNIVVKSTGWMDIREMLVGSMNNSGNPLIEVIDGDYQDAKELYLRHKFDGRELDPEYIGKTLPYIHRLWRRPVHLETVTDDEKIVYTYDGDEVTILE